jgi:hypothetical protein
MKITRGITLVALAAAALLGAAADASSQAAPRGAAAGASTQSAGFRFEAQDTAGTRWFKGNTHTHTLESDGDSPPEEVAAWYRDNGYNFLVLSDHNVHNDGGGDALGMEAVWDYLLTRGKRIYGIAVDDAHHFKVVGRDHANPGRGWVTVRARSLVPLSIVAALEAGAFYASTGVELDDIVVTDRRLEVHIRPIGSFRHTTRFIGAGGRVLLETGANPAVFELQGPEVCVRAVVHDSGGWRAWVQPVFVAGG